MTTQEQQALLLKYLTDRAPLDSRPELDQIKQSLEAISNLSHYQRRQKNTLKVLVFTTGFLLAGLLFIPTGPIKNWIVFGAILLAVASSAAYEIWGNRYNEQFDFAEQIMEIIQNDIYLRQTYWTLHATDENFRTLAEKLLYPQSHKPTENS